MKILNLGTNYFTTCSPNKKSNENITNGINYNKTLHPQEILGRSLINFSGSKFEFSENDRMFIDSTSQNMRFSAETKQKLEDSMSNYFKKNNYTSLDDLKGEDREEDIGVFVEYVAKDLDFSDWDSNIFTSGLIERLNFDMYGLTEYKPTECKYMKDIEILDEIFDKYDFELEQKFFLFKILQDEAGNNNCETVFDLFKLENNPMNLQAMKYIEEEFGKDKACDILIDIANLAMQNANERNSIVNRTKYSDNFYKSQLNLCIVKSIVDEFNINEDFEEEIMPVIEMRGDRDIKEIAFELADRYNLPSGAEEFIEETILISEQMYKMMKDDKN